MQKVEIEVPTPKPGQKIYVPTQDGYLGGLGTLSMGVGDSIFIKEAPRVSYNWRMLVKNQLNYVKLYGGSKVIARQSKVA